MSEILLPHGMEIIRGKENEPKPEIFLVPTSDVVIITGEHDNYKTTILKLITGTEDDERNKKIENETRIYGLEALPIGQLAREEKRRTTGKEYVEDHKTPDERDLEWDGLQISRMLNARKYDEQLGKFLSPVAIEGRFSGVFGAMVAEQLAGKKYAPKIERVLLYCSDPEEPLTRMMDRNPGMSYRQAKKKAEDRETYLREKAQRLHGDVLMGQYIYDPGIHTRGGKLVYTSVIDTAGKHPHDVAREFVFKLLKRGSVRNITRDQFGTSQQGEDAYKIITGLKRCDGLMEQNRCNRFGIRTVDIHVGDTLLQLPACSSDHASNIKERADEFAKNLTDSVMVSKNGWPADQRSSLS